jgi:hypothetical protein
MPKHKKAFPVKDEKDTTRGTTLFQSAHQEKVMKRLILKLCDIGHSRETSCSLRLRSRLSGDLRYIKHQGRLSAFDLPSLLWDIYLLFLILAYIFLLKLVYREREQLSSPNLFLPAASLRIGKQGEKSGVVAIKCKYVTIDKQVTIEYASYIYISKH